MMADDKIDLVINTPTKTGWQTDEGRIRAATIRFGVPMITTTAAASAAAVAIAALRIRDWGVKAMQDYLAEAEPVGPSKNGAHIRIGSVAALTGKPLDQSRRG